MRQSEPRVRGPLDLDVIIGNKEMADDHHHIEKPKLFISHATSDGEFANAVKQEIEKVFANGLDVFCTSSPGSISGGTDWLSEIERRLGSAQAVVAIVTPISVERPWLWFEVGATWGKGRSGDCKIYPLCAPEMEIGNLPSPLDRLQALSMGKAQDLKMLFQALIEQFGFGKIGSFRATNISKRIPKYKDVEIKQVDLNERALYSGKYSGYTAEELIEVIDDRLLRPEYAKYKNAMRFRSLDIDNEDYFFNGNLIHFREVDRRLELPPGTSKKLLNAVAERYNLIPTMETENIVRYAESEEDYDEFDEDEN